MKRLYIALALCATTGWASAQVSVTLRVDMSNETVSPDGVHVAGSFQGWDPSGTPMTDANMDGIYEHTFEATTAGPIEFKFVNGNAWGSDESVPSACGPAPGGDNNRFVVVDLAGGDIDYLACFASCGPCGTATVLFRVDMSQAPAISPAGVHIAGSFQGWDEDASTMSDADGDGIWTYTATIPNAELGGQILYKFINGNTWASPQDQLVGTPCADGSGNRVLTLDSYNMVPGVEGTGSAYCFSSCTSCVSPTDVTFRVDMSTQESVSANGVCVAGSFQGWTPGASMLSDADGDGIWEGTFPLAPGTYEFKFVNGTSWGGGGAGDVDNESIIGECAAPGNDNRFIEVGAEALEYYVCYNACTPSCVANPDPANITFRLDMSTQEAISPDGVYIMGAFTSPAWQAGATQMTDVDGDGIYEATFLVSGGADVLYKFLNGIPDAEGTIEESGIYVDINTNEETNFELSGCGAPNPFGQFNRLHTRSGVEEVLDVVCFNSCADCSGVNNGIEESPAGSLVVYPNPFNGWVVIDVQATGANATLRATDAMGRVMLSQAINGAQQRVECSTESWAQGVYILELNVGGQRTVQRLVKH